MATTLRKAAADLLLAWAANKPLQTKLEALAEALELDRQQNAARVARVRARRAKA